MSFGIGKVANTETLHFQRHVSFEKMAGMLLGCDTWLGFFCCNFHVISIYRNLSFLVTKNPAFPL